MSIQPSVLSFTRNTLRQMKSIDTIIPVTHQSPNHQILSFSIFYHEGDISKVMHVLLNDMKN